MGNKGKFCPICCNQLTEQTINGKPIMKCPRHGEMKPYLTYNQLVKQVAVLGEVAKHCDALGIVNLEAA